LQDRPESAGLAFEEGILSGDELTPDEVVE
jgi:hypothetical protein